VFIVLATWFYNIISKIKHKLYIASGQLPPPTPAPKNCGCATARKCNRLDVSLEEPHTVISSILFLDRISRARLSFSIICVTNYFKVSAQKNDSQQCTLALRCKWFCVEVNWLSKAKLVICSCFYIGLRTYCSITPMTGYVGVMSLPTIMWKSVRKWFESAVQLYFLQ
jgi:hypothetical protein